MSIVILDACSVINMVNAGIIKKLKLINGYSFYIGRLVLEECLDIEKREVIERCLSDGVVNFMNEDLSISEFSSVSNKYNLGKGESECIAYLAKKGTIVCTDDNKARKCIERDFGKDYYFGSLYVLRELVRQKLITCDESIKGHAIMVISGAFLPKIDESYLCN